MRTLARAALLLSLLSAAAGCAAATADEAAMQEPRTTTTASADVHSFARPAAVRSTHFDLVLSLDFERKVAQGSATHVLQRTDPAAPFVLDTQDLDIAGAVGDDGAPLPIVLGEADPILGRPLTVTLRPTTKAVTVLYSTRPEAAAMQWLGPEQTSGGKRPFLFTQGQAILTRSWIPLQDTPGVRTTWTARIRAPAGLRPVMSAATASGVPGDSTAHDFRMDQPVPSYLVALACGELESRDISKRCAVWAEPSVVDGAAKELEDMEAMVAACESLFGPYRWGRYDVLVLPPSFPFGGMENPCLTFATPTILAGDKSLVALIAHELAHSWSGNLVTNATWRDFWLNEGFTVYLEQRIMERVYGAERSRMEIALGLQKLAAEMATLPANDQVLHVDLAGRNPDDGMTQVPYEKGAAFLRRLEQLFGRERFDPFLRAWFDGHAFRSVTTDEFLAFLDRELLAKEPELARQVDVAAWIRAAGMPADTPAAESALFAAVDRERAAWLAGRPAAELATNGWVTQQWLRFLDGLAGEKSLPQARLSELDEAFALTRSGNAEVLTAWLVLAIRGEHAPAMRRLELFLLTVGRRKFVKPLYEELAKTPAGREKALAIYRKARPRYHAVTVRTIDDLLGHRPAGG